MQERRESFAETYDVLVILNGKHLAITPKIRLSIFQSLFFQRPRRGCEIVTNQQRLAALSAEIVQASCLVTQSAGAAFEMGDIHLFSAFLSEGFRARHNNVS